MNITSIFTTISAIIPSTFFDSMLDVAVQWINAGLDGLVVPFGTIACGAIFIFMLIKCIADYKEGHGEDIKAKLFPMLLCLIIAGILMSKNVWWSAFVTV